MHFPRVSLLLAAFSFVAGPTMAQTPSTAPTGAVALPGAIPTRLTVDGVRYAMAIDRSGSAHVPKGSEKLLVVEFTVENIDDRRRPFALGDLRLAAVDADSRFGEALYAEVSDRRLVGTDRPAGDRLLPGQVRKIYQGIFVNADSTIDALLVTAAGGEPVRIPLANRITPLPAELAGPDGGLPEMIPAALGRRYVVGAYDLSVTAVERQAITGDQRNEQIVVPLVIHNRLDEDWRLDRGLIPAYVTDANGERHELRTLWKGDSDTAATLRLAPGQTVTVRLHFVVPKAFQPAQLALFSRSGRGQSHRLVISLGPLVTIGRMGNVLGKYEPMPGSTPTASPGSAGVPAATGFPTTNTTAIAGSVEPPTNRPLTFPEGGSPTATTTTTTTTPEEPPAPAPAPLRAPVRHAVFELQTMTITRQHENQGDEYYLVTYPFRGLRGAGDRIYTFNATRQIRRILPEENWARNNGQFQIPADAGRIEFRDLQPYEVYGFVAVVMEADGNTDAERTFAFGWGEFQNEDGVLEVLADLFDRAVPRSAARPAYEDRTCEVVAEVDRLNRAGIVNHFGTFSASGSTAKAIMAALATPMKRSDPDDFDGWFGGFHANLPGDESCFPDGHALGGRLFPAPGPMLYYTNSVRIVGEHRLFE